MMKRSLFLRLALTALALPQFLSAADRQRDPTTFSWNPELSPNGPVLVTVSLGEQRAAVYRNGIKIGETLVSTGFKGHETPTGVFHILNKDADHHSKTYNNASMPFSERLTWGGVALHAGALPGYPSSHGCIHLPYEFSKLLFGITHNGTTVVITNEGPDAPVSSGHRVALRPGERADYVWEPEKAPSGAVSLLYSGADERLYVIRDGVTIGGAPTKAGWFSKKPKGTSAFLFSEWKREKNGDVHPTWVQAGGHGDNHKSPLDDWFHVDERFLHLIYGMLAPGSNLVITDQAVTKHSRSKPGFTVMQGQKEAAALKENK